MDFRIFPQPKRESGQARRSPAFGKRQSAPETLNAPRQAAKAAALCLGAAVLAYLVIDPF